MAAGDLIHVALASAYLTEAHARGGIIDASGIEPGTYRGLWWHPTQEHPLVHVFADPDEDLEAKGWKRLRDVRRGLPTHTPDGDEIHWAYDTTPLIPEGEQVDVSEWPRLGMTDDRVRRLFNLPDDLPIRGVVIRDDPVPPFPSTYEPKP